MTHRTARVGELIRQELPPILSREHNFGDVFVTVHQAVVAPDLRDCTIHIGILGGKEERHAAVIEQLNRAAGAIQRSLYRRVKLKNSPRLFFKLDRSAERGVHLVNVIENLPAPAPETGEPAARFHGKDGLDHSWERALETPPATFGARKPAPGFTTPPEEEDESEDEEEFIDDEDEEDDDER